MKSKEELERLKTEALRNEILAQEGGYGRLDSWEEACPRDERINKAGTEIWNAFKEFLSKNAEAIYEEFDYVERTKRERLACFAYFCGKFDNDLEKAVQAFNLLFNEDSGLGGGFSDNYKQVIGKKEGLTLDPNHVGTIIPLL